MTSHPSRPERGSRSKRSRRRCCSLRVVPRRHGCVSSLAERCFCRRSASRQLLRSPLCASPANTLPPCAISHLSPTGCPPPPAYLYFPSCPSHGLPCGCFRESSSSSEPSRTNTSVRVVFVMSGCVFVCMCVRSFNRSDAGLYLSAKRSSCSLLQKMKLCDGCDYKTVENVSFNAAQCECKNQKCRISHIKTMTAL